MNLPTLGEEIVDRGDGECAIQPTIEGGQIGARADLMLLFVGDRQAAVIERRLRLSVEPPSRSKLCSALHAHAAILINGERPVAGRLRPVHRA
jgi:hypothetical protein